MKNIAVFVSGSGSNAENLFKYFEKSSSGRVTVMFSNKKDAYALTRAERLGLEAMTFGREDFYNSNRILDQLNERKIDYIVLAGFLWLLPENLIKAYAGRIINVHPALLPKYGGKGMYGDRVHKAVVEAGEHESGITIHHVNEVYDSGDTIFQAKTEVSPEDTPESLAQKIHALEYEYFPKIVEQEILKSD